MIISTPAEMQVKFRRKCADYVSNLLKRVFFSLFFIIPALFLIQCSGEKRLIEEANHWKSLGQYDLALDRLQRAYRMAPENPIIRADLGRILSLKRISVYSGLSLMYDSLKDLNEPQLREDLLILYLDLGRYQDAREMLAPDRVPIEEFFSSEMVILRSGVHCISKPDNRNLRTLSSLPDNELKDYFLGRCYLEDANNQVHIEKATELVKKMGNTLSGCRLAVLFSPDMLKKNEALAGTIQECGKLFPGDIAIIRERPVKNMTGGAEKQRLMFSDDFFIPPYPDTDYRRWLKESEEGENQSSIE
jgi:hypothetical protein